MRLELYELVLAQKCNSHDLFFPTALANVAHRPQFMKSFDDAGFASLDVDLAHRSAGKY
jgi:predicted 2-oxoglutarate/Fe(II)-dependent dioxygenase YbiX